MSTTLAAGGAPGGAVPGTAFRRLHPLTPFARGWRWLAVVFVIIAQNGLRGLSLVSWLEVAGAVGALGLGYGWLSWRFTRYRVQGEDLQVDSGVLFRRSRHVRLDRLQAVDVVRPFVARLLGLAELRLEVVGGGSSSEAPLAYLSEPDAYALRAELLARAAGVAPDAPEAPERILVTVPTSAILASMALSFNLVAGLLFSVGVLVLTLVTGNPAFALPVLPALLTVGGAAFREFSVHFDFTVAESPDGLRLRHGLVEHRAQTVPPGRVQALRIVQPWLWRLRGWVRVQVTVAGYGGERSQSSTTAVLLPVAPRAVALAVVGRVLPGVDVDAVLLQPVPRRARWRRPVSWRGLACGADQHVFVSRRGVLRRELDVMPHARTQSVRLVQGPWDRALGLAGVHCDTTPGPVHVLAAHRDAREARGLVEAQVERARLARRTDASEHWMLGSSRSS